MAVVGIKKLILQDKLHTSSLEGFLLRYYEQIITGIWAYMVLEFIESSIYMFLGMTTEATYLTALYFVLLGIVTVVFFLSSIIIPEIRKLKLRRKLYNIGKEYNLSYQQKDRLRSIAANNMLCSGFFTKYGFVQFMMITLSNSIFVTAYFTCEYIIGSNYLMKMSDYQKGDWQPVWDGLFWRFMHVHRDFFLKNPRLGMLVRTFDKMPDEKQKIHLKTGRDKL